MGQKAHPKGLRLGIVEDWESSWYAEKDYGSFILIDRQIRAYVKEKFKRGGVSKLRINRKADSLEVVVHAARTGVCLVKEAGYCGSCFPINEVESEYKDYRREGSREKCQIACGVYLCATKSEFLFVVQ